jgi:hypothetical protein
MVYKVGCFFKSAVFVHQFFSSHALFYVKKFLYLVLDYLHLFLYFPNPEQGVNRLANATWDSGTTGTVLSTLPGTSLSLVDFLSTVPSTVPSTSPSVLTSSKGTVLDSVLGASSIGSMFSKKIILPNSVSEASTVLGELLGTVLNRICCSRTVIFPKALPAQLVPYWVSYLMPYWAVLTTEEKSDRSFCLQLCLLVHR